MAASNWGLIPITVPPWLRTGPGVESQLALAPNSR
jgi:hypothetical protein